MLNKKERMEKLNNAGVEMGKYFTFELPEGLEKGAKIHLVVDESGVAKVMPDEKNDFIYNQIIEDGYVRNTKLHRRFVMAQMFRMLSYVSYDGMYRGYSDYLKRCYSYDYTFKMMLEEVRVLSKLETRDIETFDERSHFFTKEVIVNVMNDYMQKLATYVNTLPNKHCKGVPYKRIKGANIFCSDIEKKIYVPLRGYIAVVKFAKNYDVIYRALMSFMKLMVKLPFDTAKSHDWIDAYKGEGSYYTLLNLVRFHNCKLIVRPKYDLGVGDNAEAYLKAALEAYKEEGWRMFALMKQVITDNGLDTKTYISEICNK